MMFKGNSLFAATRSSLRVALLLVFWAALAAPAIPADGQSKRGRRPRQTRRQPSVRPGSAFRTETFLPCNTKALAGEVLVRFKRPVSRNEVDAFINKEMKDRTYEREEVGTGSRLYLIRIKGLSVNKLMDLFHSIMNRQRVDLSEGEPEIDHVEPNFIFQEDGFGGLPPLNDPAFGQQWPLHDSSPGGIKAESAWVTTTGSPNFVVGVVDSGVHYQHPDLKKNMWTPLLKFSTSISGRTVECKVGEPKHRGFNAFEFNCDPLASRTHGTRIAGLIGAPANNDEGIVGVNWVTRIMGLEALNINGQASQQTLINTLSFAIEFNKQPDVPHIRVLNNSYGALAPTTPECRPTNVENLIRLAGEQGILFVASVGNDSTVLNDQVTHYPSGLGLPNIIAVAATGKGNELAGNSNSGKGVDIGAPGFNIISIAPSNHPVGSGTSFAAPFVSGAAALILAACPTLSTPAMRDCILNHADRIPALLPHIPQGRRLNLFNSVQACKCTSPP